MAITISADEIFEMACQIERNGAAFYRRGAEHAGNAKGRRLLTGLAEMEDEHVKIFTDMRAEFAAGGGPTIAPDDEAALYLRAMADGRVFDVKADPAGKLTGQESMADILHTAIGLEKDSIVFYVGIRQMVPAAKQKQRIEAVIAEETRHISILDKQLADLPKG